MDEQGLDALVVRAPDNVLYLTNFWGMKGYDACVFPREGDPVLVCLEASGRLAGARSIKTEAEIARMRVANEIAADAMEHVRGRLEPGMKESEAAAIWQGYVHGRGTAREDVELALPFSLVWSGKGIKTFTATADLPVVEGEPVLFEIWVCADGYWADHTKNLVVGELKPEYVELEAELMEIYERSLASIRPGASMAELDRQIRERIQPSHPICHGVGARAHEPPYPHQAGGGEFAERMVLAVEPGIYWPGGGGLRVEDNFLVASDGVQKLSPFPDGVVSA